MSSHVRDLREIACIAINELSCCKEKIFQIEALFCAMHNEDLTRDTLDHLILLGADLAGELANDEVRTLKTLRADLAVAKFAPLSDQSENVARESEVQP